MQADVLACEVQRPTIVETTALGAAYAAGLATGFWASEAEVMGQWQLDKTFNPDRADYGEARRGREFARWKRAVKRTLDWTSEADGVGAGDGGGENGGFCAKSFMVGCAVSVGAAMLGSFLLGKKK